MLTINETRRYAVEAVRTTKSKRLTRHVREDGIEDLVDALTLAEKLVGRNHSGVCVFFGNNKIIEIDQ